MLEKDIPSFGNISYNLSLYVHQMLKEMVGAQ